MKVAIVGLSRSTHDLAPFYDPEWSVWGLPWDNGYTNLYDRLFEMHDMELLVGATCRKPNYLRELQSVEVPLYMQEAYFPAATRYPFEEVAETTGDYWNSSIAYMLAMAIHEQASVIALFGVDMRADEEYFYQRPNIEYLLGVARGKGIRVLIPQDCPILQPHLTDITFCSKTPTYFKRYGNLNGD